MTTLCRFCREIPNEATRLIVTADKHSLPSCDDCGNEWCEQEYNNWLAYQDQDERDMRDSNLDAVRELGFL